MSTVDLDFRTDADVITASTLNTTVLGISDGFNDLEPDDIAKNAFGPEGMNPLVATQFVFNSIRRTSTQLFTNTITYSSGDPTLASSWVQVVSAGPLDVFLATTPFKLGSASDDKVGYVTVGLTALCSVFSVTAAFIGIGIRHSGDPTVTKLIARSVGNIHGDANNIVAEWTVRESDVPTGETLNSVHLLAGGPTPWGMTEIQFWAMAMHASS